jgi:adenylate cyclase
VLQLLNKQVGDFTEDDLALLEALASQASAALQNAQLFEAVEKAQREEAQLLEVTRAISTELHLIPLLGRIMSMVTKILDADRSTLFLNDEKTSMLWAQVAEGLGTATIRFPNHLGIAGSVFTTGTSINIPDAYADPRFNQAVDQKTGYRTETILCCPVLSKDGRPIGVTQVLNKRGGPFTTLDEERLMAFSAQASIAIENAKLFEEVLNTKNYAEGILQSMSNGVLTLDAEGGIVRCNAAAIRILRRPEADVVGQAAPAFFAGANAWVLESLGRVNASGRSDVAVDATLHLAGTDTVSVNLTAVPLVSSSGERLGAMLVLEDISKEKRLKGTLARYMTKEVADKLLEEGEAALGGREQEATVLFSDIRSFTSLSEALGAPETVAMLNEYFSLMVDVVFAHGGILDKYIGDAIMAVFGTPYPTGRDADHAVTAAVEMLRALRRFNVAREAAGRPAIRIGIGINTDQVVAGNIGSLRRMDYTVIGDGVNLASRLEGACKAYGSSLIISKATHDRLTECVRCREIDLLRVKGKTEPVAIYEVLAHHDETTWPGLDAALPRFAASLAAYRRAEFAAALEGFTALVAAAPQDRAAAVYAERCRIFLQTPPPLDWDGVFTMTSK